MNRIYLIAALGCAMASGSASASIIFVDGSTQGYYNAGLGDLALDPVLGAQTDAGTGFRLFPAANVSQGDPNIPPVASQPNLAGAGAATQAALGSFLGNTTALGGSWSGAPQAIPSTWAVNSETAIVYVIDAGPGLTNTLVQIGVDNGVYVWLNGSYLFGAMAPGGASLGEYSFSLGDLTGTNFLQILREDHGGGTGWAIRGTADERTITPVPEPGTFALLGMALLAGGVFLGRRGARLS